MQSQSTHGCDIALEVCRTLKILCCCRLLFAYEILTPAALNFFVQYADGAVESLWSIDQYFEFVLVLLLSTGLSFQVRHHLRFKAQLSCRHTGWLICCTVPVGSSHSSLDRPDRHCHLTADVCSVAICSCGSHSCCCCIDAINRPIHPDLVSNSADWPLLRWRSLCACSGKSKEDTTSLVRTLYWTGCVDLWQ